MSKAFTREDVDPPERPGRLRSSSGLPPGATNYITPVGVARLKQELAQLRGNENDRERIAELEHVLASATVVEPKTEPGTSVAFGARVTVRESAGRFKTYRIVGVDELRFYPDAISWISPLGKILLAGEVGQHVTSTETGPIAIVKIEYPND
jgi:transcription elongation factor GreB